jgi:hypothetical protein
MLNPISFVPIKISMYFHDEKLAVGTAFCYLFQEKTYLITNWHNVTGREPDTKTLKSSQCAIPNRIVANIPYIVNKNSSNISVQWEEHAIDLYNESGDAPLKSIWYEHPSHYSNVDVVAIPIEENSKLLQENSIWYNREYPLSFIVHDESIICFPKLAICPANHPGLGLKDILLEPGLDVFALGFPQGMSGGGEFSIWKRGSIASEPSFNIDDLPKILIDTATREGMSGAPVYAVLRGSITNLEDKDENGKHRIFGGYTERLIGIYSGRIGDDNFKAQLGIVWKASVIDEIIKGEMIGRSSFTL